MDIENSVYIEAIILSPDLFQVNLETLISLYVYQICDSPSLKLKILRGDDIEGPLFSLEFPFAHEIINADRVPFLAGSCIWPVIYLEKSVIAGLCSVARQILKCSNNDNIKKLLGFREASLMACSESSIWTKFCEIDVPSEVKHFLTNINDYINNDELLLPQVLTRFEFHMNQPVRLHNVYNVARIKNKDKDIKSTTPLESLNLEHKYGEGCFMTIADVILVNCMKIFHTIIKTDVFETHLPLTSNWLNNMLEDEKFSKFNFDFNFVQKHFVDVKVQETVKTSLYTADPNRYKPQNRIFTKQKDVENSIDLIKNLSIKVNNDIKHFGFEENFNWDEIPLIANPLGGALPEKRADRKCEQLQSLLKAVTKAVGGNTYEIVDFCSGSGHLGILIAILLPNCHIILVENKERSLERAKETLSKLKLKNVSIAQCNLDYFKGSFDLGVALHACGVATDLVIQNCIKNKAHFVISPCCYGGIHNCHHLEYPRSKEFASIDNIEYMYLAHAADQTHKNDKKADQGFQCMDIIDTDRKLQAQSCGYEVHLGKLDPPTCTPKNNLLVGLYIEKK